MASGLSSFLNKIATLGVGVAVVGGVINTALYNGKIARLKFSHGVCKVFMTLFKYNFGDLEIWLSPQYFMVFSNLPWFIWFE